MGRSEFRSDQLHRGKKGSNKDIVSKREGKKKERYEDEGGNQYRKLGTGLRCMKQRYTIYIE
jgi:hypothetical protein